MDQPNPLRGLLSVVRVLLTVSRPRPVGSKTVSHVKLAPFLTALEEGGLPAVAEWSAEVDSYIAELSEVTPDELLGLGLVAFGLFGVRALH